MVSDMGYNGSMNTLSIIFLAFGGMSIAMAFVYFYIFAKTQERFIQYWGLCWVCYSFSLLLLILNNSFTEEYAVFPFRKIFDLFNLLFLLMGAYSLPNRRVPGYWVRFSLYLTIWTFFVAIYKFDLLSLFIPIAMIQLGVTTALCYVTLKYWRFSPVERLAAFVIFGLWGYGKTIISFLEAMSMVSPGLYLTEVMFSNVLNFLVFIIYLQSARSKLGITEKRFRLLAENSSVVLFLYDLHPGRFSYITPSVEQVLGYLPNEFKSSSNFYYNLVNPEDYEKLDALFDADNYEEKTKKEILKFYHKNGCQLWCEVSATLIEDQDSPMAVEGVIRDITEMKLSSDMLVASKNSRDILLSSISHELKTPITAVIGHVSALRDEKFDNETEKKQAIETIYNKTIKLEHLIHDLFLLSKLETNQLSFDFMIIECSELGEDLLRNHRMDVTSLGRELRVKMDKRNLENIRVVADEVRIDQVFTNILSNAIRYSPAGGTITVEVSANHRKQKFYFSISDKGPGIPKEEQGQIFDRFYKRSAEEIPDLQTDFSTGLGLTICKEIVDAHGGEIYVKSSLGRGSTFMVELPLYLDQY
jgi:PAS domain S-box-containing protein